jgi:hypothetical protein
MGGDFVGGGVVEKADRAFWKMIIVHDRGSVAHLFCITRRVPGWGQFTNFCFCVIFAQEFLI